MDLGIAGKTALVFGAGGGLGGAIAQALARDGAQVALADIDKAALDRTREAVESVGGRCISIPWDLADLPGHVDRVEAVQRDLGPIDILVNNTGGPPPSPVSGQHAVVWEQQFRSMVLSVITITDLVLPGMKERGWGRVVTSTSSGVISPIPNLGLSNSLRSTLVGWSKTLAGEVGGHGITSNVVLPGRVATPRIQFLDEKKAEREGRPVAEVAAESTASIPVGRYGDPTEYGDVVAFLASARASYVTGSVIRVDGGYVSSV